MHINMTSPLHDEYMLVLARTCSYYRPFILASVYLPNSTRSSLDTHLCVCVCVTPLYMCVCHQTRQCMMLSAEEDMRTTIYNSPLSQLRHTVLPCGAGACLCVCIILAASCERAFVWGGFEGWKTVNVTDRSEWEKEMQMTDCVCVHMCACVHLCTRAPRAEGVSGKRRHVTLDKGEMRGYDWLFSDVTAREPSQLETIIRCLVTPSVPSPLLYPSLLFSLSLSASSLHPNPLPLCL